MFKKILAAVEGSEPSIHALHLAALLAKEHDAELDIITSVPPLPAVPSESYGAEYFPEYEKDMRETMKKTLIQAAAEIKKNHPMLIISTHLKFGRPATMIVSTATEVDADLIVIGSRGQSGILTWILGSTAREVADSCTVPVLVVKDQRYCQL